MLGLLLKTFHLLGRRERVALFGASVIVLLTGPILFFHFIETATAIVPAYGGTYTEGIVGQPGFINPVLARPGTPDQDITSLIFASITDLAESIKHNDTMTSWNVRIKDGAQWQDGTPITSDDIIFTIRTIQNKDATSPSQADWQNITASRVSEREIAFQMPTPYSFFSALLSQTRPIPKKIFADIDPANLRRSSYNLQPLGSGAYAFADLGKRPDGFITSYTITRSNTYATIGQRPYIQTIEFKFFQNDQALTDSFNLGQIDGFGTFDPSLLDALRIKPIARSIPTGKYYAIFFNQDARATWKDPAIRSALTMGINRQDLINHVMRGNAQPLYGPIPPAVLSQFGLTDQSLATPFDPQQAKDMIASAGWKQDPQTNVWIKKTGKTTDTLTVTITTADTFPLRDIARVIQQNWSTIGVSTTIVLADPATMNDGVIKPRNYELLLFGNIVTAQPDIFSFWHSSQQFDPGLNFALYQNPSADNLMTKLRATTQPNVFSSTLNSLETTIAKDQAAIFLISPDYLYITSERFSGITIPFVALPADRFASIASWYAATTRVLK